MSKLSSQALSTIIVFQMAKVASRSWTRLLKDMFPDSLISHFHSISEPTLAKVEVTLSTKGPAQTFRYLSIPRLGRPPEEINAQIKHGKWIGPAVTLLSGMRDPVARAVSLVGFSTNRLGYTKFPVTVRDGGTAESLTRLFFESLRLAQSETRIIPDDTLLTQLAHGIYDYRRWFKEELEPAFGVDVFKSTFDHQAKSLRYEGPCRLFVYRVEDLSSGLASQAMATSASDFLGRSLESVPPERTEGETRFRKLYKDFARSVRLSKSDLNWFYDDPTVRHFYTNAEIDEFKKRWGA